MWLRSLALACLVGAALAGPVQRQSENQCAKHFRPEKRNKFDYIPAKSYTYHMNSSNNITLSGYEQYSSTILAMVEFHNESPCKMILKLKNIKIQQKISQKESDKLTKELEVPLSFAWVDGSVENISPSSEESKQSLNIKKAIVSAMINTMKSLDTSETVEEIDGFGRCLAEYTAEKGEEIVITKKKNLRTCSNKNFLDILKKKVLPGMDFEEDNLVCRQNIADQVYKSIACYENKKIRNPIKKQELLELTSSIELKLMEIKPAEKQSWQGPFTREEIAFSIAEPRQGDRDTKEAKRVLEEMCEKTGKVIDISIGSVFMRLVTLLKSATTGDLQEMHQSLKDRSQCPSSKVRNMLIDAAILAGTPACINFIAKKTAEGEVNPLQRTLFIASISLKRDTTPETLEAMDPLINGKISSTMWMAFSTQVYNLRSSKDFEKIEAVQKIVAILDEKLGSKCSSDDNKEKLKALAAFGNMGYHGKAHDNILACLKDRSLPKKIRLAAVDSFRRMETKRPQEFLQTLSHKNEDPEVKSLIFKSTLRNADKEQIEKLERIFEKESNDQVSSYMYTCIQNTKKSESPNHQNLRKLLQTHDIHPRNKDYWTHSKNVLFSTYNKEHKVGGSVDLDSIQSPKTNLPESVSAKISSFYGDKELEMFEAIFRTEEWNDLLGNIFAMKDKLPKMEQILRKLDQNPSAEEIKEEFKELISHKVFGDKNVDFSMILRFVGTEIMHIRLSDMLDMLSGREELFKVADLLTKLARGKDADFSHSFVFMNSKIVVPSVTGRSYSIDLAGSSTVGLTGKAKADMLNLPRNADLRFHFQPSVNVEFSTSCGLESDSHRPSLKHVSRVHLESDVEVSAEIRDGHVGIVKVTLPSQDIALAKMSTDIVEIDPDHNEKSIFASKEKKIDYTFEHLSKPLGVVASAKLEVPTPFFIKRFPFIFPFGSGEIGLKRSDVKSYEMRFEIPKQAGPSMKYKASFDTPGTKFNRRFEVVGEVKRQRDQKGLVLELSSPFEKIGGRGEVTYSDKLAGASVEFYTSKKPVISANVSCETISSRSRVNYKLSGAVSILNQEPARIDGTVAVIKGRKHHVSYDIRTNRPVSKPVVLKGTIMQEGSIGLSPKSEWKLSSDIAIESPLVDLKLRKAIERRPKQTQVISANIGLDYQIKGQDKHSFAISGTSQKSSNKVNSNVKFESTQFPVTNTHLSWDMQQEESWNHAIKLNCEENSSKTCIQLKQKSHIPKTGPGYCSFALEVPQRDIHYKLKMEHEMALRSEKPNLKLEFDLFDGKDQLVKVGLNFNCTSQSPLKLSGRLEGVYKDTRIVLDEKIEETRDKAFVGDVIYRKTKGKKTEESKLHYVYKKRSDDSKIHHEIESSVKTPSSSPISSKASIELSSESLAIAGHIGPEHSIQAWLKQDGKAHLSLKSPNMEATVNYTSEGTEKSIKAALKTRSGRMIMTGKVDLGDRKHFEVIIEPDDREPEKRIVASIGGEAKSGRVSGISRINVPNIIDVSLTEEGDESFFGDQEITLKVKTQNRDQFVLNCKNTIVDGHAKLAIAVSKNNKNKINIDLDAGLKHSDNKIEVLAEISCKSKDLRIKDMRMSLKTEVTRSESSLTMRTDASLKKDGEVYKAEWDSDIKPDSLKVTAEVQTPHANWEKTAVGASLQVSDSSVSSSVKIACSNKKKILIQTKIETRDHGLSLTSKVSSESVSAEIVSAENEPFAVLQVTLDNHQNKKVLKAQLHAKNKIVYDAQGMITTTSRDTQYQLSVKSDHPDVKLREFNVNIQRLRNSASASVIAEMDNKDRYTLNYNINSQEDGLSATLSLGTPKKNSKAHISMQKEESKTSLMIYLDSNGKRMGDAELSVTASSQGIQMNARSKTIHSPEISAHAKWEKSGESILAAANVMKGASPLFSTSINRLSNRGEEKLLMKTKTLEDTLLDLEISKEVNSYILKAKGPFSPVHVKISRNSDKKSINTELLMCRHKSCYSLKCNSESMKHHIYLEKSNGQSTPQKVGIFKVALTTAGKSEAILETNGKKYGLDLTPYQRKNDNDRCSLVARLYVSKCISEFSASMRHSKNDLHLQIEITSNTDKPNDKLSVEIKSKTNPDNHERTGHIKAVHRRLSKPFLFTFESKPVGDSDSLLQMYDFKAVLHSGPVFEKTWTIQGKPNIEQEAHGSRSMEYILSDDKNSTMASMLLNLKNSREEKRFECNWKLVSRDEVQKAGVSFILSNKNDDKIIKVMFWIPSADYEVQGSPNDINFSISSSGRKLKEINIKVSERCAVLEYRKSAKSDPEFRSHICINKPENKGRHLVQAIVEYHQIKCGDFRVTVDQENPENVEVIIRVKDKDECQALKEQITGVVSEIKREIKQVLKQSKEKISEPISKLHLYLNDCLYSNLENMRKESIRLSKKIKEYLLNIYHTRVPAPVKKVCQKHYQDVHREATRHIKKAKEVLNQFWPNICEIGWYCNDIKLEDIKLEDIKLAFQKFDSKKAQRAIERKINEISESLGFSLWPSDMLHYFQGIISRVAESFQNIVNGVVGFFQGIVNSVTQYVQRKIIQVFGRVVGKTIIYTMTKMIKKVERYTQEKEMKFKQMIVDRWDGLIDTIHHFWSQDENVQAAKQAVVDGKNEILDAWRNRDHIVRSHAERVKSNITENLKKLRDDQIEILRYDPKNGVYNFKIIHMNNWLSKLRDLVSRLR